MASTVRTYIRAAWDAIHLGGNALQQRTQRLIRLARATRHDRRTVERALFTTGDSGADKVQAHLGQLRLAANGVGKVCIACVDDNVALLQQWSQLIDHRIGPGTGLHHDQHLARPLQRADEVPHGFGRNEGPLRARLGEQ